MKEFWNRCCQSLRQEFTDSIYQTWIAPLAPSSWNPDEGILVLVAESASKASSVRRLYLGIIEKAVQETSGNACASVKITTERKQADPVPVPDPAPKDNTAKPSVVVPETPSDCGLLPKLTFENFVAGPVNQLAYAAAQNFAAAGGMPGSGNPLYIYGGVGLGKTHLMHAIGHRIRQVNPKARILCISADHYVQEFIRTARKNTPEAYAEFDQKYRSLDVLLIDDVQAFANRTGTQNSFFSLFEDFVPRGKRLVLTSDTYTSNLKEISTRLVSRFASGLCVELQMPEPETRQAILLNKADQLHVDLPEETADFIARLRHPSIRELEASLNGVIALARYRGMPLTIDIARQALKPLIGVRNIQVTVDQIQKEVAEYYGIKLSDMYSQKRPRSIAMPRQIAMYLCKELTQKSLPDIGESFGGRDHTTVLHAVRKIEKDRKEDPELNNAIYFLEQRLKD